ncbi:MAG: hypothetical protein ACXWID_05040 [Pyrinomonadaceae bacterium]
MSIQNELSTDIAVALLARGGKDPEQLKEMKDLIFRIHATLQEKVADTEQTLRHARAAGADRNNQSESNVGAN